MTTPPRAEARELRAALNECTGLLRELLTLLRPVAGVEHYPGGRIGWAIQRARIVRGFSPAEFARRIGVSRSSVVTWEFGRAHPSPRRWMQLVALFPEIKNAGRIEDGRVVENSEEQEAGHAPR